VSLAGGPASDIAAHKGMRHLSVAFELAVHPADYAPHVIDVAAGRQYVLTHARRCIDVRFTGMRLSLEIPDPGRGD